MKVKVQSALRTNCLHSTVSHGVGVVRLCHGSEKSVHNWWCSLSKYNRMLIWYNGVGCKNFLINLGQAGRVPVTPSFDTSSSFRIFSTSWHPRRWIHCV